VDGGQSALKRIEDANLLRNTLEQIHGSILQHGRLEDILARKGGRSHFLRDRPGGHHARRVLWFVNGLAARRINLPDRHASVAGLPSALR